MRTTYIRLFSLLALLVGNFVANAAEEDLFDDPFVRDEISLKNRPIYFDNETRKSLDGTVDEGSYLPKGGRLMYFYLPNRLALTGESCNINKLPTEVTVGGWTGGLEKLLNDDLDDYCEINAVAKVGLTVNPVVSIRDRSAYYAKGTTAGFCIVAGSGSTVLSLDVIKAMSIGFYRDGVLIKSVPVQEGQDGSGVTLNLIQIPGTSDACVNLTAEAPGVFDEIMLDLSGGLQVDAGTLLRIKYAFVGKSRMFTITKNKQNGAVSDYYKSGPDYQNPHPPLTPYQAYEEKNEHVDLNYMKGWNPVLLGLPFPLLNSEVDKLINENLDDYASLTPIIAVGYQGGAKFMMKDTEDPKREIFEAGTEVGFCYDFGSALALDVGSFLNIVLFDRNGNKVDEQNVQANVLSLGVAKGGFQNTSLVSKVPFSGAELRFHTVLGVDVGGIFIKYAYVRDKADIRHHCPINPSMDTNICSGVSDYQLRSNPNISVTWTLKDAPAGSVCTVTPDGQVSGLGLKNDGTKFEEPVSYIFVATAADGCQDEVVLRMNAFGEVQCAIPMVNFKDKDDNVVERYTTELKRSDGETSGSLITIDDLKDRDNVLHDDDTYARYVGGLKLGDNIPVIGVRQIDGGLMYDATKDLNPAGRRMGFMIESAIEGLNLSVLSFYQIRCYHEGKEVYRHVIDESNTISADIGGSNKAERIRYSILVPPIDDNGQQTKVDQIILWTSGVLELKAGELRIFNAFWEEGDAECGMMGCSTSLLTTDNTHTTLDFERFQMGQAVAVAGAINDLDNIVDDDIESFATIFKSVDLSGVTIAIKLGRTLDYRHQLGLITDNNSYVAAVKVADVMQVKTLYQGEDTGEVFNDWNVVDANVIGYGDKKYTVIKPTYVYDEVLLTFVGTVNVLNDIRIYGLYLRDDADGDGLPDCQDTEPCSEAITKMEVNEVCVGDYITVWAEGIPGDYIITYSDSPESFNGLDEKNPNKVYGQKITIESNKQGSVKHLTKEPGMFQAVIYDKDNKPVYSVAYRVHPSYTEWLPNASNSDWNKWDNWTKGSPYCCTNVVIPSEAVNYPDLDGAVSVGDEYCCNYIHFQPGAEVNSVMNLNYAKAWTDLKLTPNSYHLLSAPFHSMYTGDMFIPAEKKGVHDGEYFLALDGITAVQNRFNPTIYQRMWETTAEERLWTDDNAPQHITIQMKEEIRDAVSTKWSGEFNHLATPYLPGEGFSLWVDNGNLPDSQEFSFRFPKEHDKYNYFIDFPQQTMLQNTTATLTRSGLGRFIYEEEATKGVHFEWKEERGDGNMDYIRDVFNKKEELSFTLDAKEKTQYFLFGNSFMSGIDVRKFISENSDNISGIITYDGNTTRKVEMTAEGALAATTDVNVISPMQSVFVIACNADSDKVDVKVTTDMLRKRGVADAPIEAPGEIKMLRLRLSDTSKGAAMLVAEGMRSEALFDNEVAPSLGIYVAQEGKAFDIAKTAGRIPLTIIKTPGEGAMMEFDAFGGLDRDEWRLYDLEEVKEYTLDHPVSLPTEMGSSSGRFILMNFNNQSGVENIESEDNDIIVSASGGMLSVKSLDEKITRVQVFDLEGRTIADRRVIPTSQLSFPVPQGVCLVSVTTKDVTKITRKILVK